MKVNSYNNKVHSDCAMQYDSHEIVKTLDDIVVNMSLHLAMYRLQ